ncbi:hypothetical protein [Streptomyces canus]|uniref:hypothetical protein n=1 Tax=Streptomyces canus TaxID=58343 RepID=UPI0032564178
MGLAPAQSSGTVPGAREPRDYHGKRDFARTGGPQGREGPTGAKPRFVVQIQRSGRTLAQVAAEEN